MRSEASSEVCRNSSKENALMANVRTHRFRHKKSASYLITLDRKVVRTLDILNY